MAIPVISSDGGGDAATITMLEKRTRVTQVVASGSPTYSIDSGADAASFSIDGTTGVLSFGTAPVFRPAGDADTDNVYAVVVAATNGDGADTQSLSIRIRPLDHLSSLNPVAMPCRLT